MNLAEAAAQADELAQAGSERELATLRQQWDDELEAVARQFRYRQKLELLRRGLDDESPAVRGASLVSVQLLSRGNPGVVNAIRALLHTLATSDPNNAVRRLAIVCLRNGSPQRETVVLLNGLAEDDDQDGELRRAARAVAADLRKRAGAKL
jgi:hypothetical protein